MSYDTTGYQNNVLGLGRQIPSSGSATDIIRTPNDQVGNLYHFGARYYDPSTATWTQQDPISQMARLSEANPYVYAGGDPVDANDPTGLAGGPYSPCGMKEKPPTAPWYVWVMTSFAGGWGLQLLAVGIGIGIGLLTAYPLAGAVGGIFLALLLTQVVLPLAFRRSGWTWGITARRRR